MKYRTWRRSRFQPLGPVFGLLGLAVLGADQAPMPSARYGVRTPSTNVAPPSRKRAVAIPFPSRPPRAGAPTGVAPDPIDPGLRRSATNPADLPAALDTAAATPALPPVNPPTASLDPAPPTSADSRTSRPVYPIDLVGALRLAGARDLDIAIARERTAQALADLERARVLWLPSFFLGPNWTRHDGQIQDNRGHVFTISRSSLFIGGTASAGSAVIAPPPGGGTAQVSSLTSVLRLSDAIFEPLAARQVLAARRARIAVATNDTLLELAEAYFDLQQAAGNVAIAREALTSIDALVELTGTYARTGGGLEADHQRSLTEQQRRRQDLAEAVGRWKVASAELVRRTRLDPRVVVAPVEPPEATIRLVSPGSALDDLIIVGLRNRPELAEAQALVQATLIRLKQARLRPLVPSVALRLSAGGFGGGVDSFFGNFNGRQDADANLYWELQNFGLGDRAIARSRAAEQRAAVLGQIKLQDRVASEVVSAFEASVAAEDRLQEAGRALPQALRSVALNLKNIQRGAGLAGATRPIEVLQPIQALAQARANYLDAALAFNRAQFRLYRALGQPPTLPGPSLPAPPGPAPLLPNGPEIPPWP